MTPDVQFALWIVIVTNVLITLSNISRLRRSNAVMREAREGMARYEAEIARSQEFMRLFDARFPPGEEKR